MGFFKKAAVTALAVAAVGASTGIASADPSTDVNYEAKVVDKSIVTTIDAGLFKVSGDGKSVVLQDSKGADLVSLPLAYNLGDLQFPFDRAISEDGKTLTLTPITDSAKATPRPESAPAAKEWTPVASPEEMIEQSRTSRANSVSALRSGARSAPSSAPESVALSVLRWA